MKFQVKFTSDRGDAVKIHDSFQGLEDLDWVRKTAAVPALNPFLLKDYEAKMAYDPKIEITEAQARESGLFQKANKITVTVSEKALNDYVIRGMDILRETETGAVSSVYFTLRLDENAVLEAWKEAGFPVDWRPAK